MWRSGREVYVFKPASPSDVSQLKSNDWGPPVEAGSADGAPMFWVNDTSAGCHAKGFYATRGEDGSFAPASAGYSFEKERKPNAPSRRAWQGYLVDCHSDTTMASRGKSFYQFRALAQGEAERLDSKGLGSVTASGRVNGKMLFWVADTSFGCRSRGFYAQQEASGALAPVGASYSYAVGKSTQGSSIIIESDIAEDAKPKSPSM
jgi:hypothetical protein